MGGFAWISVKAKYTCNTYVWTTKTWEFGAQSATGGSDLTSFVIQTVLEENWLVLIEAVLMQKKKSNLSGDKERSFFGYPSFQESLTNQRDSSNLSWSTEDQIHQDSIPIFFCSPKQWLYIHQFSCSLIPEVPTWQICVSSSVLTNMRSLMHKAWQALVLLPLYF